MSDPVDLMKTGVTYDQLQAGHSWFESRVFPNQKELFTKLAKGQKPKVTMVTCSDSRIDPCALTQTGPGDLFVIRNAGNIVPEANGAPSGELASLEFAVQGLGTEHIVVVGHSDCGAMKGLLAPQSCAHLSHVSSWVRQSQAALTLLESEDLEPAARLERAIEANVLLQLENLRKLDFIKEAEEAGKLQLHGWVYNIGEGGIRVLSDKNGSDRDSQTA